MRTNSTIETFCIRLTSLVPAALAAWILLGASVGSGQQVPAPDALPASAKKSDAPAGPRKPEQDLAFRVFRLKFADALGIRSVLMQVLGDASMASFVVADLRTNSILVRATPETTKKIEGIIEILDIDTRDAAERNPLTTKIFTPINLTLDGMFEKQLMVVLSPEGRIALDPRHNAIVVQDTVEGLSAVEALVARLDEANEKSGPKVLQVRVVWLISGMDRPDAAAVPADLKKVVDDLAKIGVEGLKLAAQVTIQAVADGPFEMKCSPELENPCELAVSGAFLQKQGGPMALQIRLSATETLSSAPDGPLPAKTPGAVRTRRLCELDTTVVAPLGHTVALGTAPVGKMTSVFVVQLTKAE